MFLAVKCDETVSQDTVAVAEDKQRIFASIIYLLRCKCPRLQAIASVPSQLPTHFIHVAFAFLACGL